MGTLGMLCISFVKREDFNSYIMQVLFTADLRAFEDRIPKTKVKEDNTSIKLEQQDNTLQVIETQQTIDKQQDGEGRKRKRNATTSPASRTVRRSTRIKHIT